MLPYSYSKNHPRYTIFVYSLIVKTIINLARTIKSQFTTFVSVFLLSVMCNGNIMG